MPDDSAPRSPSPIWDREEPLFGPRSTGEIRARRDASSHSEPIEDALSGPLFGQHGASAQPSDAQGVSRAPASPSWAPRVAGAADGAQGPPDDARNRYPGGPSSGHRYGGADGRDHGDGTGDEAAGDDADPGVWPRSEGRPPEKRSTAGSFFRELPVLLLIAFILAFLLRTFVVQVFYIPSSSMEPTLQINDRMAVEKITYQFREPRRGEIVVFEGEELGQVDPDASFGARVGRGVGQFLGVVPASARDFVKRVIGLPGDEILIEDGQVFVNGTPIDEPYVVYPDGASYGPVTVPEDSLFFLGDNRPNSSDSRRGLGFVPMDDVVGRAAVIIWPPPHMGSLTGVEHELPDDG